MYLWRRREAFDREGWKACAEFGVLGMPIPQEYGGLGLGLTALLAVMEGLGYGTRDQGLLFSINAHLWTNSIPILMYGTDEQRQTYLPGLCDGSLIGANGASEPDAGSDIFSMRTRAVRDGDDYVLNGTKTFVTNAPVADLFVVYATIDPKLGATGITAFIVERDTPGLTRRQAVGQDGAADVADGGTGLRGLPRAGRQPARPRGPRRRRSSSARWNGSAAAFWRPAWASMRRQLEDVHRARAHAQAVRQADRQVPVGRQPDRRHEGAARHLPAAGLPDRLAEGSGTAGVQEAAIAKLYVSECFVKSSLDAVQIFGGYGYMTEQESSATCATRSAARSTRAPPRSSATSSPARSDSERGSRTCEGLR